MDPLPRPWACSDPHVIKPVFCVDAENVGFQDLNRPSSGSNIGFVTVSGPLGGEKPFLDPLPRPWACSDPHVIKPVFCVDAENVCFQDLNRPSSGSNIGFVGKEPKMYLLKPL